MKKLISVLSIAMLLMCGVFVLPDKAAAAIEKPEWDEPNKIYYGNGNHLTIVDDGDSDGSYTISCEGSESVSVPKDTTIYIGKKDGDISTDDERQIDVNIDGASIEKLYTGGANGSINGTYVGIYLNTHWLDENFKNPVIDNIDMANTGEVQFTIAAGKINSVSNMAKSIWIDYYSGVTDEATLTGLGFAKEDLHMLTTLQMNPCDGGKLRQFDGTLIDYSSGYAVEVDYGMSVREHLVDWGWSDEEIECALVPVPNEGMKFVGWYTDPSYVESSKFDVDTREVTSEDVANLAEVIIEETGETGINLYAKWEPVAGEAATAGKAKNVAIKTEALTKVEGDLKTTKFNTVEKIQKELLKGIENKNGYTAENTAFHDVTMRIKVNGVWKDAEEHDFPLDGITVILPYPKGTDKKTHEFVVTHMFTLNSDRLGTTAGEWEQPKVKELDEGLQVTFKGLSPVAISYKEVGPKMGNESGVLALFLMTVAAAGITGGTLMMRRKAKATR